MTFALGARLDKDERSRAYAHTPAPLKSIWWRHYGPILDQQNLGSCTGNGPVQLLNTGPWHQPRTNYLDEAQAINWYSENTRTDPFQGEYPPDDTGSSLLATMKTGRRRNHWTGYRWAFTGAQGVAEMLQTGPVILATTWLTEMFNPDPAGLLSVTGDNAGGHCYLLHRYTATTRRFAMINSWGDGWGLNGHAWIRWADLNQLLLDLDGEAAQPTR